MRFTDLKKGDVFELEGGHYEVERLGDRIVIANVLEPLEGRAGVQKFQYVSDPKGLAGDEILTTAFSDMRFEREHLTDFERQCDEDLKNLL